MKMGSLAAKSLGVRRGAEKVRHLKVREFWMQERKAREDLVIKTIKVEDNLADVLTRRGNKRNPDGHMEHQADPCSPADVLSGTPKAARMKVPDKSPPLLKLSSILFPLYDPRPLRPA